MEPAGEIWSVVTLLPNFASTRAPRISLTGAGRAGMSSKYGARYAYGHVVEDGRHLIVSGGLGTSFIPARLGVPPEVVQVVLGA